MIPTEVENRVAKYSFHRFLPEEVMVKIVDRLLTACVWDEEEDLDFDELVRWAIEIIDEELEDKRIR
ncbi:hypothetical protein JK635_05330 [Neobacillus sp. YIM B02564]|uniref:Uncharacterized protein n=1 Tax=Neobacillus paridis TaxID=2803862 RepID=A0ABS1TKE8_9BACI|nr:hypothetical protein [Neobacillus paridis]MBL4951663.1 hypothetical protein [Neobacillus paridis]